MNLATREDALDEALELGPAIMSKRHDLITRLVFEEMSDALREALTARFFELETQWAMLTAAVETRH